MSRAATQPSLPSDDGEPAEKPGQKGAGAPRAHLTLKDMVRGARTTARAVRFYEEQGLISTLGRSRGGHRIFADGELDKLQLVLELRTCGFSIEEIREILESKQKCGSVREAAQSIQGMLARHIEELHRKISTIQRLGREFSTSISLLDRCVHCTDPRGVEGCASCDLPRAPGTPHSFRHIWGVAGGKPKGEPGC